MPRRQGQIAVLFYYSTVNVSYRYQTHFLLYCIACSYIRFIHYLYYYKLLSLTTVQAKEVAFTTRHTFKALICGIEYQTLVFNVDCVLTCAHLF